MQKPRFIKYAKQRAAKKYREYFNDVLRYYLAYLDTEIKRSLPIPKYPPGAKAGGLAIVGENGPETVIMQGGRILGKIDFHERWAKAVNAKTIHPKDFNL